MEAWHGTMTKSIGVSHTSIFKFLNAIKSEQTYQTARMAHIEGGQDSDPTKLKYKEQNDRILKILKTYKGSPDFDLKYYLNGLAHNVKF